MLLNSGEKMKRILTRMGWKYAEQTAKVIRNPEKYNMKNSNIIGNIGGGGGTASSILVTPLAA
jgi:hypothetical protein